MTDFPLNLPTGPFSSGPAHTSTPAPPPVVVGPPPAPTPTPTPPTTGQVDPRDQLAEILSPVPGHPVLRKGKVTSLSTTGSTWSAYVVTEGYTETPRRMGWNGNGSKPAVGDAVLYYNASPVPFIIGRIATDNQDQDFGTGTVTGGDFVDGSGSIRDDLTSTSGTVSSLSSTVSSHTSSISSLNSTVSGHTTTINSHTTSISSHTASINSLVAQMTSVLNTNTTQQAQINALNQRVFIDFQAMFVELFNRMANAESRLTAGGH